jgi:multiple sugar transport system substrate-binding protein
MKRLPKFLECYLIRRRIMKRSIVLVIVFLLVFGLAGCTKEKENIVRFATWDSEEALEIQKSIAARFEELHPGVKVQVEAYGDGYDQKMAAGFGAKNAPDVMYMWDFPSYQASLEPLNTYMEGDASFDALKADLYPGILNYSTIGEDVLGLPVGFTSHVIYYNKSLFDQAGVAYPTEGWTWNDLREKAKAISALSEDVFGFAVPTDPDPYDFEQFLWTNGTAYLSEDGSEMDGRFNSKESVEVMQFFSDMIAEGSAWGAQESVSSAFRGGNIAMQESGIWPLGRHKEAIGAENLGVVSLPGFGLNEAKSVINSSALCMAKDSSNKEMAWEFIKFYTSDEAVRMRAEIDLPVLRSTATDLGYTVDEFYAPFYVMLESSDGYTPSFLLNSEYSKISENIYTAIETTFVETINGVDVDVKQILNTAVEDSSKFFE